MVALDIEYQCKLMQLIAQIAGSPKQRLSPVKTIPTFPAFARRPFSNRSGFPAPRVKIDQSIQN